MVTQLLAGIFLILLGGAAGMLLLSRWWIRLLSKPENAAKMLNGLYSHALAHGEIRKDPRACECCGYRRIEVYNPADDP